jgi:hypothetical protein
MTKVVPNVPVTKVEICWTIVSQDIHYFPVVVKTSCRPVRDGLVNGSGAEIRSGAVAGIAGSPDGPVAFTERIAAITAAV